MLNKIINIISAVAIIAVLIMLAQTTACQTVEQRFMKPIDKLMTDKELTKIDKLCVIILSKEVAVKPNNNYAESQRCFNLIYTDYINSKCGKLDKVNQVSCYNRYRFRK